MVDITIKTPGGKTSVHLRDVTEDMARKWVDSYINNQKFWSRRKLLVRFLNESYLIPVRNIDHVMIRNISPASKTSTINQSGFLVVKVGDLPLSRLE